MSKYDQVRSVQVNVWSGQVESRSGKDQVKFTSGSGQVYVRSRQIKVRSWSVQGQVKVMPSQVRLGQHMVPSSQI